jgi:hypothetical protein
MQEGIGDLAIVDPHDLTFVVFNRVPDEAVAPVGVPVIENAESLCDIHLSDVFPFGDRRARRGAGGRLLSGARRGSRFGFSASVNRCKCASTSRKRSGSSGLNDGSLSMSEIYVLLPSVQAVADID